jgi:hypothetical protein
MRRFTFAKVVGLILAMSLFIPAVWASSDPAFAPSVPFVRTLEPYLVKVGDLVKATGYVLNKDKVAEVYLTAKGSDYKLEITGQTDTVIRFKIPEGIPVGRYRFMVLLKETPKFLEQPVYLEVVGQLSSGK